jgi:hypothetical protein
MTTISMISLSDNLQMPVSNNSDYYCCIRCKAEQAEIFHDSGDYCLECWQYYIHPDIISNASKVNSQLDAHVSD